jgi:2-polyprenyl-6-methoxyphenol hydroxylase-like FAD-dependent oxidoreductase
VWSQGVNTSIEDAAALQVLLRDFKDFSELPKRLQALEEIRIPRTAVVQYFSALTLGPQRSFATRVQPYLKDHSPNFSREESQEFIWRYVSHSGVFSS